MMQVTRRWLTLPVLAGLLAACGSDGPSAPDTFDPAGTTEDAAAIEAAFSSPAGMSLSVFGYEMSAALGNQPVVLAVAPAAKSPERAAELVRSLAKRPNVRASLSSTAIPDEFHGVTFVWDPVEDEYVPSEETGAPANGVRFMLYAINPLTWEPSSPLTEIGYADLTGSSTATGGTARIVVKDLDGATYLDYSVVANAGSSAVTATVSGYATNGTDRANFAMTFQVAGNGSTGTLTLDYSLDVPNRSFGIDSEITMLIGGETAQLELDVEARGPHGWVDIAGTLTEDGGEMTVRVNGKVYAKITFPSMGQEPTIAGPNGEDLTADELKAIERILEMYEGGFEVFDTLMEPVAGLLGAVA